MEARIIQKLDYDFVCERIENSSQESSIYVGTDSLVKTGYTRFATVVVIHKDSCRGGECYFESIHEYRKMSLRERLLREVQYSVTAALMILDSCGQRKLEVHIDINENDKYASNIVIGEAKGYVKGQGLVVKAKPESWCSSIIADHFSRSA